MIDINIATHQHTGQKVLLVQAHPEPLDVPKLLRILKMNFPAEWDSVHLEISAANGRSNGLVLPP
jgi:hypothetical protein